jgi:hypothetical protein
VRVRDGRREAMQKYNNATEDPGRMGMEMIG